MPRLLFSFCLAAPLLFASLAIDTNVVADDGAKTPAADDSAADDSAAGDSAAEKNKKEKKGKGGKMKLPKGTAAAIKGTPKIDGKVDAEWKKVPRVRVSQPIESLLVSSEEDMAVATVQLMWDETHVYALWRVTDKQLDPEADEPWQQDSVELFLDQDKKGTTTYQADDAQYRVNCEGEISGQGAGYNAEHVKAATSVSKNGYVVEMAVEIDKVKLKPEMKLGLELQVNDNAGDGTRNSVTKWVHTEDDSWEDTSNFGTLLIK